MPYITFNEQKLFYAHQPAATNAPALVLVHGAGGSHLDWPAELRRLPETAVYALDLPGHGRSAPPGYSNINDYAKGVLLFLETLHLQNVFLVGHSMGGAIAQAFALSHPQQLRGLVLVATGARLRVHPDILQQVEKDPARVGALLVEWVHGQRATPEQKRQYLRHFLAVPPAVLAGDWQACNAFDSMARLGEIRLPALVIGGTQDQMTPLKYAAFLCEQLPDADLTTIEGGGHMLMIEQPGLVIGAISGFLARLMIDDQ
ncbi:MAG: alpha/beta hydrolase [Caldilineales bacterium]|nr:alpha/beta hydrolase [Caldilineales bacterium]